MKKILSRLLGNQQQTGEPTEAEQEIKIFTVPESIIPLALKSPMLAKAELQKEVSGKWGDNYVIGENVRLGYSSELLDIPHSALWITDDEKIIDDSYKDIASKLSEYSSDTLLNHVGKYFSKTFLEKYLYMTMARVWNLRQALISKGFTKGSILEIGSQFGPFALPLQRMGYDVTVVDRYNAYGSTLVEHVQLMQTAGVEIVATGRDDEAETIKALGEYDCVINMAVIEHIPPPVRLFAELLRAKTRKGGLIAIDTPNLARYWNRRTLAGGGTIFTDMETQYDCEIPFEGHYREYIGKEMVWLLEHIGCMDVELVYFDYNLFQFEYIDTPHIQCLMKMLEDPEQADTILVCGRLA